MARTFPGRQKFSRFVLSNCSDGAWDFMVEMLIGVWAECLHNRVPYFLVVPYSIFGKLALCVSSSELFSVYNWVPLCLALRSAQNAVKCMDDSTCKSEF